MKSVHIRDLDEATLSALKRLALSHHRSLQGELVTILERAARLAPPPPGEPEDLDLVTVNTEGSTTWRREEIYDADTR